MQIEKFNSEIDLDNVYAWKAAGFKLLLSNLSKGSENRELYLNTAQIVSELA